MNCISGRAAKRIGIGQIIGRCNLTRHNVAETEQGF